MKRKLSFFYVLLLVYLIIWVIMKGAEQYLRYWGVDITVLHGSHLLLWLTTLVTFRISSRSLSNPNPQVSARAMLKGILIKFFVIVLAAFVYIIYQKKQVNIPALIGGAFLYILYAAIETRALLQELRRSNG